MADADEHQRKRQKVDGHEAVVARNALDQEKGSVADISGRDNGQPADTYGEPPQQVEQGVDYDAEFGSEVAFILESEANPTNPGASAQALLHEAQHNPAGARAWIESQADGVICS